MVITLYTVIWAVIALLSALGLYFFNTKPSIMAFITKQEYLVIFLIASIFGMRESYPFACIIAGFGVMLMVAQYPVYSKFCIMHKKNKDRQEQRDYQHRNL